LVFNMSDKSLIYLDYGAATPVDANVLKAMQPYFAGSFFNPSATYRLAREVRSDLDSARAKVAFWLGSRPSEVIFTAGGSEANNLAIHGVMRRFPDANIVVSAVEHESVLASAAHYDCRIVDVRPDGSLDLDDLKRKIDDHTVLVSIMYANNEIGTIQPIREVAKIIKELKSTRRTNTDYPLYLHSDACQAANYLDLHVARLEADMMTLNGGKIYGPKQSGALYVNRAVTLIPLIDGGGQERGLRSGTENVAGAIGLAAALDMAQKMRREESDRLNLIQKHFIGLLEQKIPGLVINGSLKHRLPNNVHVTIPGSDNERLLIGLDENNIAAAAGSACSASSNLPSHVLRAIGLSDAEARASLRFTMGRGVTADMIERTVQVLADLP
jgi:cysteine desulfurase